MKERRVCRCSPRRLLLLAATALLATGFLAGSAAATSTNAADEEPLLHPTSRSANCGDPRTIGTPTGSTAIIKKNADNTVSAQVTLKNAFPNNTYEVHLIQTPSGSNCLSVAGTLRTNGQGNGNERVSAPLTPGDTGAYVAVFTVFPDEQGNSDFQQTALQVFGLKD